MPGAVSSDVEADVLAVQTIPAVPTILDVLCRTTGMGFAAVARVTEDRWVACGVKDLIGFGLQPGGELAVRTTICDEVRRHRHPVVIDNVAQDEGFRAHPTPALYGFQSYASFPIILSDGRFYGTLCAIDPRPARLDTPETRGMFTLFAELIAFHLNAQERLGRSAAVLAAERSAAKLREQFIAVLGHDLRSPLASIDAGATLLKGQPLDGEGRSILELMRGSVSRMAGLIDNVLDFARGRLVGGLTLARRPALLEPVLRQVVAELASSHRDRVVNAEIDLPDPVVCDSARLSQLVSNLVGNALTHGAPDQPVRLTARVVGGALTIEVTNRGEPIPAEALPKLFDPFERGGARGPQGGLGLGLYICNEIARAHDGGLSAASTPEKTVFTFRMPL